MSRVTDSLVWGSILGFCLFSASFVGADEGVLHFEGSECVMKNWGSAESFGAKTETFSGHSFYFYLGEKSSQQYPSLSLALEEHNKNNLNWLKEQRREIVDKIIPAALKEGTGALSCLPFIRNIDFKLRRADSKVLSFVESVQTYDLGAHGYDAKVGHNFDVATGKKIEFSEVIQDKTHLAEILEKKLEKNYPDAMFFGLKPALRNHVKKEDFSWTLDPQGVTFYFNPYDLAPYCEGMLTVTILFKEQPQIFADKYKSVPENYCMQLNYYPLRCDLEDDGLVDSLQVVPIEDNQYKIILNNLTVIDKGDNNTNSVLVHTRNGRNYLYVDSLDEHDNRELHVYDLNTSLPEIVGKLPYTMRKVKQNDPDTIVSESFPIFSDPDNFTLYDNNKGWIRSFKVSENGLPVLE
ncbi:DUF3298 domain-containing protein [bacterium]|nr:DUF3298 domain-containing protein [bacterium]